MVDGSVIRAFSAIVSPKTLNDKITSNSMTIDDYVTCLEEYDKRNKPLGQKNLLQCIGLPKTVEERINYLYHSLSKQIHCSPSTFLRPAKEICIPDYNMIQNNWNKHLNRYCKYLISVYMLI